MRRATMVLRCGGFSPDCLVRDNNPSGRQHVLDHSQAERKTEIEPHGVGDDLGRETMAAIKRGTVCHAPSPHIEIHDPLS